MSQLEDKVFQPVKSEIDLESQNSLLARQRTLSVEAQRIEKPEAIDKVMANNAMDVMKNLKFQEVFKNQYET